MNLRDRPDGTPRIPAARLLLDGNGRAQAGDLVDVGLGQLPQELAGVRAKRFKIPPLSLGEQRIKGKAALSAARHAREADELAAR